MRALVGIFVGGKATRMGGIAKGLLPAPDTGAPLVDRLAQAAHLALENPDIVLVGVNAAYMVTTIYAAVPDAANFRGPIGGLVGLLQEAERRQRVAIAMACDLAYVTPALIARLATHAPDAAAVAPRVGGIWQPLFARYAPERALAVARGVTAPYRVLEALSAVELPLSDDEIELLRDWDSPEDVR